MFKAPFVGRSRELEVLDNLWDSPQARLLILYGRRRVGKTRLLSHWLQQHPDSGLYWVAEPASALTQLRSFSQALMSFRNPDVEISPEFSYASWELAFSELAALAKDRRIAMFIDEVTYLIDVDPEFVGTLQKVWDGWLSKSNLMLALAGSQMGLMRKHLLDYQAPLYGRLTAQIDLPSLPPGTIKEYFPDYSPAERIMLYAMWGGVPAYWERLNPDLSIMENLRQNILPSHAWMIDESRILLQDFITDLHNYVGIMRAIANGQHAISDISKLTGLTSSKASFYLSVLRDTGFVARYIPITKLGTDTRSGHYSVTDPYLRFFYRFLSAYQSKLALGQMRQTIELLEEELPTFIQNNTWPELCRQWVLLASANDELPVPLEEVGSEWGSRRRKKKRVSYRFDVAGIGSDEKGAALVLGDCYWTPDAPKGPKAIHELVRKTDYITLRRDDAISIYYTLFAAGGWSDKARAEAERITGEFEASGGQKFNIVGIRLLDLIEVDNDLVRWSV